MISIIVPVLNEADILKESESYYKALSKRGELIFVDGGSSDETVALASQYGDVTHCLPSRGGQKNVGAEKAQGKCLLFLHVDSFINIAALDVIEEKLSQGYVAGCFRLKVLHDQWVFRLYEWTVDFRAKNFGVFDGDLGLFIEKKTFDQLGGFPNMPIMEDIEFSKRLKQHAKICVLPFSIVVSSRKWGQQGFWKTLGVYAMTYLKYWLKIGLFKRSAI